jgi:hypothetical protein
MRKIVTVLALLALVATANATVRVFVTKSCDPYGLQDDANAFVPTASTVYANGVNVNGNDYEDYYYNPGPIRPDGYPPANSPSGTCDDPVVIPPDPVGQFGYIWLQFQSEVGGATINGLQVTIRECGSTEPSAKVYTCYYVCNNRNNANINDKRWDGTATPPLYPEWLGNNPQTMVAITAYGIQNKNQDLAWNLWKGTTYRIALLGAVSAPFDGTKYTIDITNISYLEPPNPSVAGGAFQFFPEPASLLLMGLAGLLIRRR